VLLAVVFHIQVSWCVLLVVVFSYLGELVCASGCRFLILGELVCDSGSRFLIIR